MSCHDISILSGEEIAIVPEITPSTVSRKEYSDGHQIIVPVYPYALTELSLHVVLEINISHFLADIIRLGIQYK